MRLMEKKHEDRVEKLQIELNESKVVIDDLKRNSSVIEVYKKKLEGMAELRAQLTEQTFVN